MTQPNNTTIPNAEPNTSYAPTPQGPTPTDPLHSPQSTLPTSITHNHAIDPSTSTHQTSQLPPPTFNFPNGLKSYNSNVLSLLFRFGIVKPIDRLSLHTFSVSPIPKNSSHALKDPNWRNAMYDEYNVLVKNSTWLLVPRPTGVNMVCFIWLFKHKFHDDATLSCYKDRLVANGSSQQLGVDFDKMFSPVVKSATIRTVLSLSVSRYATRVGFYHSRCDSSLFIHRQGSQVTYLFIYVDDIILTDSYPALLQQIIGSLNNEFDMTDLEALNYFLGISTDRTPTKSKLVLEGAPVHDPTLYRSLAGGVQYLTFTRPDLSYAVQHICLYMHDPRESHFAALKRILFTSGYCVFLDDNFLSWSAKRQHTLSRSSAKAKYRGVANVVAETAWLHNLLRKLHTPLSTAILVYCDNVSAVYMSANPVQHQRTKHIEINIHFVRDMIIVGQVRVLHVPSLFQYADIFTKGLTLILFEDFQSSLSVRPPPAQTAGA
nr:ribonuclease H-like domain-containing protein [Tanacetum cinerariifolium]